MLVDVNTLIKKTIEHKKCYIKNIKDKTIISLSKVFIYYTTVK